MAAFYAAAVLPSGLSMLWESVDPDEALRTRFGFAGFAEAVEWISTSLADGWAITAHNARRLVISDHNAIGWVESLRS